MFGVGVESNSRNIDSGQTISDNQSRILFQLQILIVSNEEVTASETP